MLKTFASVVVVATVLVVGAFIMVAVSGTVDFTNLTQSEADEGIRVGVETLTNETVEWLPNTIAVYKNKVIGQLEANEDVEFLLIRANLMNPDGDICESVFDHAVDLKEGQQWQFEMIASGCTIDKVLLYAKSF